MEGILVVVGVWLCDCPCWWWCWCCWWWWWWCWWCVWCWWCACCGCCCWWWFIKMFELQALLTGELLDSGVFVLWCGECIGEWCGEWCSDNDNCCGDVCADIGIGSGELGQPKGDGTGEATSDSITPPPPPVPPLLLLLWCSWGPLRLGPPLCVPAEPAPEKKETMLTSRNR